MEKTKSKEKNNFLKENFLAVSILSSAVIIGVALVIAFGPNMNFCVGCSDGTGDSGANQQITGSPIELANLKQIARNLGANGKKFDSCLDSGKYASAVESDINQGSALGVGGTPTFFINNEIRIIGAQPYATFAQVIDAEIDGSIDSLNLPTCISEPTSEEDMDAYYGPCWVNISINIDGNPVEGDQGAPVTMIGFSDYECSYCKRFASQTLSQIKTNYIDTGRAKFVFKDFPLIDFHLKAQKAAEAARCMRDQLGDDGYWKMHDAIFEI